MDVYLWVFTQSQLDEMEEGDQVHFRGKLWNVEWLASDKVRLTEVQP